MIQVYYYVVPCYNNGQFGKIVISTGGMKNAKHPQKI